MSSNHPYGKNEQVFKFTQKSEVEIFTDPLKKLLMHPDVKYRKIVAFSLIGAYRKGKSFFLGYCLRFLYANVSISSSSMTFIDVNIFCLKLLAVT